MHTDNQLEALAALLHQGWINFKTAQGVSYGEERTATTHPHMVGWEKLDNESRNQDRFIASALLRDWTRGALAGPDLAAAIHNAWVEWSTVRGEDHPHAKPYHLAHPEDPEEHAFQAELVAEFLEEIGKLDFLPGRKRECLVLLPLKDDTKAVYDEILTPAIRQAGYEPVRADLRGGSQAIHDDIVNLIERAEVVLADLTHDSPSVNYEIGIAKSLGRPLVMTSVEREMDKISVYYRDKRLFFYNPEKPGWKEQLGQDLQKALHRAVGSDPLSENHKIGLSGFYKYDDHAFERALMREIERARHSIVAMGWGMAFLNSQRRELMGLLRKRVQGEKDLAVHILMPRPDHPGLTARIEEEAKAQPDVGIHPDWPITFFEFAKELPRSLEGTMDRERVFVHRLPYLPTAMVVKLDHVFFFRSYGPPKSGGWACPWLRCDTRIANESWSGFLESMVQEAVARSYPEA